MSRQAVVEAFLDDPRHATVLWSGAVRYYLGRMSAGVGVFCEMLAAIWPILPEDTRAIIERDIEEEFRMDDLKRARGETKFLPLGMDCDRESWERVRRLWLP